MGFTRWTKIKVMRADVPADDGGDEGREEE
jgi:hypothetical protein